MLASCRLYVESHKKSLVLTMGWLAGVATVAVRKTIELLPRVRGMQI